MLAFLNCHAKVDEMDTVPKLFLSKQDLKPLEMSLKERYFGSFTKKVVPLSGSLSTVISPP